ncbi:phage tail fiber protein [Dickeya chrysanthemi]|uniref:phage tail fiber domain-containing protein n=1 Tax=Dickeya chrysanthemi TaxID=556 RepID=UPI0003A61A18|nr:phage tail fiber protein [Dickeya chrysanthemi]
MAVPEQTPYNVYTANGATTVFPYEFYLIDAGDMSVSLNGSAITTGFSLSDIGNVNGGNVTFLTPPAAGTVVMLERVIEPTRTTDYQDNGDLLADTVNLDFDRIWMAIKRVLVTLGVALTRPLFGGPYNANGYRIANLPDPVNDQDAATQKWTLEQDRINAGRAIRVPDSHVAMLPPLAVLEGCVLGFVNGAPVGVPAPSGSAADVFTKLASTGDGLGDNLMGVRTGAYGAVNRTQHDKNEDRVSAKDFGAVGDGLTDDTSALRAAFAYAAQGNALDIPGGKYLFSAAINVDVVAGFYIRGAARGATVLEYVGADTDIDLLTLGSADGNETFNIEIKNIIIQSVTNMTGGYALRLNKCSRVTIDGFCADRINGPRKLYNGVWFNDLQQGHFTHYELYVKGTGLTVNGAVSTQHGADLWMRSGMAVSCNVAVNVAGGFGGFYIDDAVNFGCGTSVLIDNSKVSNGNRELFFGPQFVSDGAFEAGIHFNDTYANNSPVNISGFIASSGVFGGVNKRGLYIQKYTAARVVVNGAQIFNCKGDAVVVQDTTVRVTINHATYINLNTGHAVYSPVPNGNISSYATVYNNTAGDYYNVCGDGVWQQYPAASAYPSEGGFGAAITSMRYRIDRRTVIFKCEIGVANNGTGTGAVWIKLPIQPSGYFPICGININTGLALTGYGSALSDVKITGFNGAYPVTTGQTLVVTGTYEI